jgi:error-prone DNA polymerase
VDARRVRITDYDEFQVLTHFPLLCGASIRDELFATPAVFRYLTIRISDIGTVAGVVRAW